MCLENAWASVSANSMLELAMEVLDDTGFLLLSSDSVSVRQSVEELLAQSCNITLVLETGI